MRGADMVWLGRHVLHPLTKVRGIERGIKAPFERLLIRRGGRRESRHRRRDGGRLRARRAEDAVAARSIDNSDTAA